MWVRFTAEARRAILAAQLEAQREGRATVLSAHLLLGVLDPSLAPSENAVQNDAPEFETAAARIVSSLDVEPQLLRLAVQSRLRAIPVSTKSAAEAKLTVAAKRALEFAADEARKLGSPHIGSEHILLGIARTRWETAPLLLSVLLPLASFRLISEERLAAWLRGSDGSRLLVADVLAEFHLDSSALRLAAAGQNPDSAKPQWTNEVQRAVDRAQTEARATGAGRIGAEHLWLGLLGEEATAASERLQSTGIDGTILARHLRQALRSDNETAGTKPRYSAEAKRVFQNAEIAARNARCRFVGSDHLLLALAGVGAQETSAQRAQKIIGGEGASRAEAAIASALQEQNLAADFLRLELSPEVRSNSTGHHSGVDVVTRVAWIVAEELDWPVEDVVAETDLLKEARSHLVILEMLQRCSREFGISFSPDDVKSIRTVSELANAVVVKVLESKTVQTRIKGTARVESRTLNFLAFMLWPFGSVMLWLVLPVVVASGGTVRVDPVFSSVVKTVALILTLLFVMFVRGETKWKTAGHYLLGGLFTSGVLTWVASW
ncbi:MAG TPA: Clp protease N-terminal domain-containing protein [Abditibacteriaceae bacterium]|jgi:acyl carrier protein